MKITSAIIKILSFVAAAVTLLFLGFMIYDWVTISQTTYAGTVEFWLVIELYTRYLLTSSFVGLAFSLPNCFIDVVDNNKKTAKIMSVIFGAIIIIALSLQLFCKYC